MNYTVTVPDEQDARVQAAMAGLYPIPTETAEAGEAGETTPKFTAAEWPAVKLGLWLNQQVARWEQSQAQKAAVQALEVSAAPPAYFTVTKIALITLLRSLGLEDSFYAALAADTTAQRDWDAVNDIRSDHPTLLAALPGIAAATGMTEEAAMDLLEQAAALSA